MTHLRLRTGGLGLLTALVIGGIASGVASAEELPELGRCVKLKSATGVYTSAACTTKSAGENTGTHEWEPGPGPKAKFTGTGGVGTLEMVGGSSAKCTGNSDFGEFTGSKEGVVTVTFTGCGIGELACTSEGAAVGEIITVPSSYEIGFITTGEKPTIGVLLKPLLGEVVAEARCGPVNVTVTGSVIGKMTDNLNKMNANWIGTLRAVKGKQNPESFAGGSKQTLSAILNEEAPQQLGQTSKVTNKSEEALEAKIIP